MKKKSLAALMTSAAFVGGAPAQESAGSPSEAAAASELTEIVVSAQRRDESIQRVPISVQALVSATLEQHQVESFDDYTKLLPSVSFQSLGPGKSQLFFRGVTSGSDGDALSAQPTASVYLDDIPVTTIGGLLDVHIYDVERVEALSGPQGTLFGANSLSGTLRIITNKPDPSAFKAGYDLQLNKFAKGGAGNVVEAFVNMPLSDKMALRAVGFYQRTGGYIDNTLATRTYQRPHTLADGTVVNSPITVDNSRAVEDDFNSVDTFGGRLALGINLDDSWTLTPSVTAQEQQGHGSFLTDPRAGDLKVHDFLRGGADDKWYQASLAVQGKISNWDLIYSGGYMQRHNVLTQDYSYYTVAYDAFPDYTYFQNKDGTPLDPTQFERYDLHFTKQTHEVRLSSPTGGRFNITTGLFYQEQTNHYRSDFYIPGLAATVQAPSWIVADESIYRSDAHRVDRDYAVFGQADYHITSSLTLTGGIRGYKYRNSVVGFSGFHSTAVNFGCVPFTSSCVSLDKSADGSGETHKASLAWQVDPDLMVYATYSTGFRPGGINRRVGVEPYGEDTLSNYEIGWKTTWLDHRLRLNGAVYHERWNGIQYGVIGFLGAVNFINAGDANIDGIELDGQLKLGGFSFSASAAYNDARLATPFCTTINGVQQCDLGVAAPKGTRLPVQPRFKDTVTVRYDFNSVASKPFVQVSMLNQTDATSRLRVNENEVLGSTPGFSTFDFSAGFSLNQINLEFFMQNVFDKRGELSRNAYCGSLLCYENYRSYPAKPRLFGVKMAQRF
jgi:iron complex outermembrane receptor protein